MYRRISFKFHHKIINTMSASPGHVRTSQSLLPLTLKFKFSLKLSQILMHKRVSSFEGGLRKMFNVFKCDEQPLSLLVSKAKQKIRLICASIRCTKDPNLPVFTGNFFLIYRLYRLSVNERTTLNGFTSPSTFVVEILDFWFLFA